MKVGDLVTWATDSDIGLVIGFVPYLEGRGYSEGHPIIQWMDFNEPDDSVSACHTKLEVISELAQLEAR